MDKNVYYREYYAKNKEKLQKRSRERYYKPGEKERVKAYLARPEVHARLKEYNRQYQLAYYHDPKNHERIKARQREYMKEYYHRPENCERRRLYEKARRERSKKDKP